MWAQDAAKLSHMAHHRRVGDRYIEIEPAIEDLLGQLLPPGFQGPRFYSRSCLFSLAEGDHRDLFANPVWKRKGASYDLV